MKALYRQRIGSDGDYSNIYFHRFPLGTWPDELIMESNKKYSYSCDVILLNKISSDKQ